MGGHRPTDWHVLDLEKDPTPGDPDRVRQLARELHEFAEDVGTALRQITSMASEDAVLKWSGRSAKKFKEEFDGVPGNLRKLRTSYDMAGDAIAAYWPKLERAQSLADRALKKGREARADLNAAQGRLDSTTDWVKTATAKTKAYDDAKGPEAPDESKVRAATRNAQQANSARSDAQGAVDTAQSALDAAKAMAAEAKELREDAARVCQDKLDEASDAGIQNRSWWEEIVKFVTDSWDAIVSVCKVIVAVVGVIAMIVGGPILAAIVVVAAVIVLADTLIKFKSGKASLFDVGMAALDCIPGVKGITTAARAAKGIKSAAKGLRSGGLRNAVRGGGKNLLGKAKPAKGRCKNGDPIDMVSGEMLMEQTDVVLPGVLPLVLQRTHLSTYRWGRCFGESWASALDQRLELDGEGAVFAAEDGMLLAYPAPQPGRPVMPVAGPRWPLEWDGTPNSPITISDPRSGLTRSFALPAASARHSSEHLVLPLQSIADRNGNEVTFEYDDAGLPTAIRHTGGYHIAVDTADGRVTGLRLLSTDDEPDGTRLLRYTYDGNKNLAEIYNSSGRPFQLTYDDDARITSWTDRNGSWYRFIYDAEDRCIRGQGINGILSCALTFDTDNNVTRYTNSLGHTLTYRYNERLQLVSSTNALGASLTNEWDDNDRLLSQTDALGNTTGYTYDAAGNVTRITRADGSTAEAAYNELHQLVHAVTPGGQVWEHAYDNRGNHTATVDPSGTAVQYEYDSSGALVAVTDAAGNTSRARCNAAGLPLEFIDVHGAGSRVARDAFGRATAFTDAQGRSTEMAWTVEGKMTWRRHPDGRLESWEWDAEGNLTAETDPAGNVYRYLVGPFGQVAQRIQPDGTAYASTYDTELNLLRVTDPHGQSWEYTYDAANRVTSERDFSGRSLTFEVDAMGELVSRTNGAGESIHFRRDQFGRTVEMAYDGQSAHLTYDALGNVVREDGEGVTVEREFSPLGLLLAESINGRVTRYRYDALGRRISRVTPTGIESTWTYDPDGQPQALETAGHHITFSYDAAHREISRRLPGDVTLTHAWDGADRLTEQQASRGAGESATLLQHRTYSYRADGVPTSVSDLATGTRRFTLDPLGRVTGVDGGRWTERYTYDGIGNIVRARTPGMDDGDQERAYAGTRIQRTGRTVYERDGEGRIIRTVRRLLNGQKRIRSYTWNSQNQLVGTTTPDGTQWRYAYDPAGRRIAKQRLDEHGGVSDEVLFVWDGARLIEQTTRSGHTTSWDYSPGSHFPLAQLDHRSGGNGSDGDHLDGSESGLDAEFHAIVSDLSGTPSELISATGEVAWKHRATLWGAPLPEALQENTAADGVHCPLRFPGQYADAETGWHYNFHRHYDPGTGQYTSPDPLGLAPSANDSAYVANPYSWIDPLGLVWQDPNNGMRFGRDPSLPPGPRQYTRENQYPGGYRQTTHDHMTQHYTAEGRAQGRAPLDANGSRIPRDQLTWYNGRDEVIWNPQANNPKPFHKTVTYEHRDPVVNHWNNNGRFTDRPTRNNFYNDVRHMEPMHWSENSSGGARMNTTYIQQVGPGYSCS
ncbi:RHS repeat-associated core domain-containing protein [Streptomyces ochraceiscleroticus]|uniref:RHS repeat-associated core domain-containing protein n=3 Tax=Streptomyces ochraceiscleroticus TaxID=47761 RepID=A0ABW1MTU0_9ACTN